MQPASPRPKHAPQTDSRPSNYGHIAATEELRFSQNRAHTIRYLDG
jgi:hypothetical protein